MTNSSKLKHVVSYYSTAHTLSNNSSASLRFALDVPDFLYMMEEAEGAQDPFFGLMESHQLCSPYKVHQVHLIHTPAQPSCISICRVSPDLTTQQSHLKSLCKCG